MADATVFSKTLDVDGYLRCHRRKLYLENELKRLQESISYVEFNEECKELLTDYVVDARKEINFLDQVMKEYLTHTG